MGLAGTFMSLEAYKGHLMNAGKGKGKLKGSRVKRLTKRLYKPLLQFLFFNVFISVQIIDIRIPYSILILDLLPHFHFILGNYYSYYLNQSSFSFYFSGS